MAKVLLQGPNGSPVHIGDTLRSFRGDEAVLIGWSEPRHAASTGRVYARDSEGQEAGYFPSVFGCVFVVQATDEAAILPTDTEALLRMTRTVGASVLPSTSVTLGSDERGTLVVLDGIVAIRSEDITVRRVEFGRKPYHERVKGFVMEAWEGVDYSVPYESMAQAVAASFEYLVHIKVLEAMAIAENDLDMAREGL